MITDPHSQHVRERITAASVSDSRPSFVFKSPSLNCHVFGGFSPPVALLVLLLVALVGVGGLNERVTGSGVSLAGRECHVSTRAGSSLTPSRPRAESLAPGLRASRTRSSMATVDSQHTLESLLCESNHTFYSLLFDPFVF